MTKQEALDYLKDVKARVCTFDKRKTRQAIKTLANAGLAPPSEE